MMAVYLAGPVRGAENYFGIVIGEPKNENNV